MSKDIKQGFADIFSFNPADAKPKKPYPKTGLDFSLVSSGFAIALHMHQPTIPASGNDLKNAGLISNLEFMMRNQDIGDNHNAPVFLNCYYRMADIMQELLDQGYFPRIMLDYSGNLLWGLRQMGEDKAIEKLAGLVEEKKYSPFVEWLGTMWSHAVVSSTPVPDIKLHIQAWLSHFKALFGKEALLRVKGFSPPEMHLPVHPDICYEYVKSLKQAGYQWFLVQEHTIELDDGQGIKRPHFPHRLRARNSLGQVEEITVFIKTQGSDTKLVGQMQPYYEAKTLSRQVYAGKNIPPLVLQISDGENGGVMMNEFVPKYKDVSRELKNEGAVGLNVSEYLEQLKHSGVKEEDFIIVQPKNQHKIWEFVKDRHEKAADEAIENAKKKYPGFNLEQASWTNDRDWVKGYKGVLDPINSLSVQFHKKFKDHSMDSENKHYRNALLYLLLSQTSCFRYWGEGIWTEYAKEICRRGLQEIEKA